MPQGRSFWVDIFKKSPLIGTIMAVSGIIGLGLGIFWFGPHFTDRGAARVVFGLVAGSTCGGIAVGLVLGVIVDSIVGAFRKDKKKRRPPDDRYRSW